MNSRPNRLASIGVAAIFLVAVTGRARAQAAFHSADAPAVSHAAVTAAISSNAPDSGASASQPIPDAPAPQSTQSTKESQREHAAEQLHRQEHQRIFGIVPYFNTSNVPDAAPLSSKQKFQLMLRSSTDPFEFIAISAVAGFGQAVDSHAGYGQGAAGYGKRYGAAYADSFDGALWGNAILPSLLHQDPRYFRRGTGTTTGRILYALSAAFWSRNDNGKMGPNYSNVIGNVIAGGISNVYYPQADRGVRLTFQGAAIVTLEGAAGSLFWEFWPDVAHKLLHTPKPNMTEPATSGPVSK